MDSDDLLGQGDLLRKRDKEGTLGTPKTGQAPETRHTEYRTPNLDEYVSEILACVEGPITDRDLAESVADSAMSQGYYEGRDFSDVVTEIMLQIPYYR